MRIIRIFEEEMVKHFAVMQGAFFVHFPRHPFPIEKILFSVVTLSCERGVVSETVMMLFCSRTISYEGRCNSCRRRR